MTVSKLQIDIAKNLSKGGEVARFLDSAPGKGLGSPLLRNLWAIAHASTHIAFRCLARMSEELVESAGDGQAPLFDTPEDHAMTVAEIEAWIDSFKGLILGDYQHDDTGRGDFEGPVEPAGGIAGAVKRAIFQHGDDGIAAAELETIFDGDEALPDGGVAALVWAMVHVGEVTVVEGDDGDVLVAEAEALSLDIVAMLEAQPALGTEDGIDEDAIVAIPLTAESDEPPELVDAISVRVFAGDGATRAELYGHFGDEPAVDAALEYLCVGRKIEAVLSDAGDESKNAARFVPFGQDLDALHGDSLRAVYERETGDKAGRKGETRMRDEVVKVRAERLAQTEAEAATG